MFCSKLQSSFYQVSTKLCLVFGGLWNCVAYFVVVQRYEFDCYHNPGKLFLLLSPSVPRSPPACLSPPP
jgi:hypothetical protein